MSRTSPRARRRANSQAMMNAAGNAKDQRRVALVLCNYVQQVVTKTEAYLRSFGHKHCSRQVGYKHQFTFKLQWSDLFPSGLCQPSETQLANIGSTGATRGVGTSVYLATHTKV